MPNVKFFMADGEITRSYLGARDRAAQIAVLADLNAVPEATMRAKLLALGLPLPDGKAPTKTPKKATAKTTRTTEAPAEKPERMRDGAYSEEDVTPTSTVQELYQLLGRFIRAGWGEAPLTLNGKPLSVKKLGVSCDFHNRIYLDMKGTPQ